MSAAACVQPRTALYHRRRPERTLLYRIVQTHLASWLALSCDSRQGGSAPVHVEREFRRTLECGILAHGFARAHCGECGHDFLIAFSCPPRGLPSGRKAGAYVLPATRGAWSRLPRI